jgi:hypothetical protein
MLEYIRRYFFARAICKKRGIRFIPLYSSYKPRQCQITYEVSEKGCNDFEIWVGITNKYFYASLAHELGHYIDVRVNLRKSSNPLCCLPQYHSKVNPLRQRETPSEYEVILLREMKASRNARRVLKTWNKYSEDNIRHLVQCFGTYSRYAPRNDIADITYIGQRYIELGEYSSESGA